MQAAWWSSVPANSEYDQVCSCAWVANGRLAQAGGALQVALQLRTKLARGRRWFIAGCLPLVFSSEYGRGLRVVLHISPAAGPLESGLGGALHGATPFLCRAHERLALCDHLARLRLSQLRVRSPRGAPFVVRLRLTTTDVMRTGF